MIRPKYTRRDNNHAELVGLCRELGIVVFDLADLGGKVPDTVMCYDGICLPVEIKSPGNEESFTPSEIEGMEECCDVDIPWVVAVEIEDILRAFGMGE